MARKRVSPSSHPELDLPRRWREEYDELMTDGRYTQTEALEELGRRYDASYSTLRYWLFKNVIRRHRARYREQASDSSRIASTHDLEQGRKRAYVHYHLDEVLDQVFRETGYEPLDLRDLATLVKEYSGVAIRASSILKHNERFGDRDGTPLLEEVVADEQPKYVLHPARGDSR